MRLRILLGLLIGIGLLCSDTPARAANGVAVESKTVSPGDTNVSVGIYIENDVPVVGIVIPLEIRSLDRGAYIAAPRLTLTAGNRLFPWEKGSCFKVVRYAGAGPRQPGAEHCPIVVPSSGGGIPDTAMDFISPDAVMYSCVGVEPQAIAPGADGEPGDGKPSLVMTFDVTRTPGRFEIDTTCIPPANHLTFVSDRKPFDHAAVPISYFNKGVVTIQKK